MSIKDAGASLSFSEINDELGESATNTLDILSAAQQFTGLLDDDSVSMSEFYGLTFQAGSGTYGTRNSHAFRFVVEGDGTKKGFADGQLVSAAQNDDSGLNDAAGEVVSGQSDFVDDYINNDLTNGDTVFANSTGTTLTNLRPGGDFASGTHFMLDTTANDIFQIDSDANVSNVVSRVPSNPSHSMTANDADEITIKITSDTIVTRDLLLYRDGTFIDNVLPTSSGSIGNTGVDTNFTYTGLSAGTSYTIGVRQANTHDSSSLITEDYSTTAATTAWSNLQGDPQNLLGGDGGSEVSNAASIDLANGSGDTVITLADAGGIVGTLQIAYSTSGDPGSGGTSTQNANGTANGGSGYGNSLSHRTINNSTYSSGTLHFRTKFTHNAGKDGTGSYTVTFVNNSVSNGNFNGSLTFGL